MGKGLNRKNFFNTITFKLTGVSMAVMIPVSLIILGISGYAMNQMREEVYLTKKSELELQMGRIDNDIQTMEARIEEEIEDNYMRLTNYQSEEVVSSLIYDVWKRLQGVRQQRENVNVAFLVTNWDHHVYITYDRLKYEYEEYCQIEDYLNASDFLPSQSQTYVPTKIGDREFFIYTKQYANFAMGYLVDQEELLQSLEQADLQGREEFAFVDGHGLLPSGEKLDLDKKRQKIELDGTEREYYVIPYRSSYLNYEVVRMIPTDEFRMNLIGGGGLLLFLVAVGVCAVPSLISAIHRIVIHPMKKVTAGIQEIQGGNLKYQMGKIGNTTEFRLVQEHFNQMTSEIKRLRIESYEKDIEKLEIEKMNLRLQLNPHLQLNSLNIIHSMAQAGKTAVIGKYVMHLVDYFRYSIRRNDEMVTVEDEIAFVRNFLEIQSIRFPERFSFVYDIDDEAYEARIPALLIENFVENSVKYALKSREKIEIIVNVKAREGRLSIAICDTGNGMSKDRLEKIRAGEIIEDEIGRHIGIWNCRKRLKLYFEEETDISISSVEGEGTQVWLELPVLYEEERE